MWAAVAGLEPPLDGHGRSRRPADSGEEAGPGRRSVAAAAAPCATVARASARPRRSPVRQGPRDDGGGDRADGDEPEVRPGDGGQGGSAVLRPAVGHGGHGRGHRRHGEDRYRCADERLVVRGGPVVRQRDRRCRNGGGRAPGDRIGDHLAIRHVTGDPIPSGVPGDERRPGTGARRIPRSVIIRAAARVSGYRSLRDSRRRGL